MKSIKCRTKTLLGLILFLFTCTASFGQQSYSDNFVSYMSGLENFVQNDLYSKVSQFLYDVEETPEPATYIEFVRDVKKELYQYHQSHKSDLMEDEVDAAESFIQTMLIQLAELYLDRAQEYEISVKQKFLHDYLRELGLNKEIQVLSDDIARSIMMALHSAMKIPFGMTNDEIASYVASNRESDRELLLASSIINDMLMLAKSYDQSEKSIDTFKKEYHESSYTPTMEELLTSLEKLKPGAEVENFSFIDLEGKSVSLEKYKDKIIYLDLWASWCGPCIQTFRTKTPDFEMQLRDQSDIVLVYVSIDEKEESWKNFLDKNPLRGEHLYAGKGFEAPIMKYFKVWGIPRYLIIGKDNKLVNPNAPRPGDEALSVLFEMVGK
ncbi:TlpA family protein disulfide reductase [Belliella kenyensis]|uniref:TlpA family protein disulfide reductase n=1 Tax=Belliella kenyensis TaxID=1472724 RepID=A0ABV8EHZ5_9BACT|nr:TlpA disulfide reductase family protein [Belliella kenyensis]MCH7401392.1 TlpA family protein disulfide reductase [Belliella kenyensis]MDN3602835.1 TlpA disulfide reductase family protein [Belliella kenyensis]